MKASKGRIKNRKSTPAPPTKGGGRKRLVLSPFPEDKQLRKRIDFGDANSSPTANSRCRGAIFPDSPTLTLKEGSTTMKIEDESNPTLKAQDLAIVCYTGPVDGDTSPEAGEGAGGDIGGGRTKDSTLHHLGSNQEDPNNSNEVVGGEMVNFPNMNLEPKLLLESTLESNLIGESHGGVAVGHHSKPNNDNILSLAHFDSAEMFDSMVAQPLIAGGSPEIAHSAGALAVISPMALGTSSMALAPPSLNPEEMEEASTEIMATKAPPTHTPPSTSAMEDPKDFGGPSLEEFPPLGKGRTLKIRDTFEAGSSHRGAGSAWAKPLSAGRGPYGSETPKGDSAQLAPEGSASRPFVGNGVGAYAANGSVVVGTSDGSASPKPAGVVKEGRE